MSTITRCEFSSRGQPHYHTYIIPDILKALLYVIKYLLKNKNCAIELV